MTESQAPHSEYIRSNRIETNSSKGISYESTIDRNMDIIESATQAYGSSLHSYRRRTVVDVSETNLHRVFRVEQRGNTLIVTPRGDSIGFGVMEYQTELNHVLGILENPKIPNLIVDLGFANYFGSQMIGAINSMIVKVRDAGGQAGVCDVSEDMLEGLSVMKLDDFWTIYATRNDAIRLLVTEPLRGKIRRRWRWVAASVIVVLASVGVGHFNFDIFDQDDTDLRYYRTVTSIYEKYSALKSKDADQNEWKIFAANSRRELDPIYRDLVNSKYSGDNSKVYLFHAIHGGLGALIENPRKDNPVAVAKYNRYIEIARVLIVEKGEIDSDFIPLDKPSPKNEISSKTAK